MNEQQSDALYRWLAQIEPEDEDTTGGDECPACGEHREPYLRYETDGTIYCRSCYTTFTPRLHRGYR
jgi:hypothetical protein